MYDLNPVQVWEKARAEAKKVADAGVNNDDTIYPSGSAWIVIKPAKGRFVSHLRKNGVGYRDVDFGGYAVGAATLSGYLGKNMEHKEAICYAAADILRSIGGLVCEVHTRLD